MLRKILSAKLGPETVVVMGTREIVPDQPMGLEIKLETALGNSFLRNFWLSSVPGAALRRHSLSWLQAVKTLRNLCSTDHRSVKIQQ